MRLTNHGAVNLVEYERRWSWSRSRDSGPRGDFAGALRNDVPAWVHREPFRHAIGSYRAPSLTTGSHLDDQGALHHTPGIRREGITDRKYRGAGPTLKPSASEPCWRVCFDPGRDTPGGSSEISPPEAVSIDDIRAQDRVASADLVPGTLPQARRRTRIATHPRGPSRERDSQDLAPSIGTRLGSKQRDPKGTGRSRQHDPKHHGRQSRGKQLASRRDTNTATHRRNGLAAVLPEIVRTGRQAQCRTWLFHRHCSAEPSVIDRRLPDTRDPLRGRGRGSVRWDARTCPPW